MIAAGGYTGLPLNHLNNTMKIFLNGKRIDRDPRGRFAKTKSFFKSLPRIAMIAAIGAFIGGYFVFISTPEVLQAVTPETIDLTPAKIAELKADLVSRLSQCESAGHKEDDGIIIFDSNKVASVGTLQFQIKTVQHYYKTLYSMNITAKEAVLIALDHDKAAQLAEDIIFEADGLKNWLNCANKLGLRAEVNAINRLSK